MPDIINVKFSQLRKVNVIDGFFILLFALFLNSCDFYYRNVPFVPVPPQTVSGPVVIGSEWIEIAPPESLRPLGSTNWIQLGYKGFKEMKDTKIFDQSILEMADGRNTKVEAFLYDEQGSEYELELTQSSVGPELYKKGKVKWSGEPNFSQPDYSDVKFPFDRVFTKLKIRSEIPLECDKIEWVGNKPK